MNQMDIFDCFPTIMQEPDVGALVERAGAIIPHIMRQSYIDKKVAFDVSTQHRTCYCVGVLEKIVPAHYYHGDQIVACDRSIVYTGKKQRSLITHMPGREIHEVLPWEAYERAGESF